MERENQRLTARLVRRAVAAVCTLSVAGMIACAATHHLGGVVALGCCSSAAILTLMAVVATESTPEPDAPGVGSTVDADQARAVERIISELRSAGADEERLRDLAGAAMRLGRRPSAPQ
jgi:hypothetical protein